MIKWALREAIDKFERDWNYDAGYMRDSAANGLLRSARSCATD